MVRPEKQFINEVAKLNPKLKVEPKIEPNHVKWGTRVKFNDATGVRSFEDLQKILAPLGIKKFKKIELSGRTKYKNRGYLIEWQGHAIKILLNSSDQKQGFYPRKTFSPEKLGLGGYCAVQADSTEVTRKAVASIKSSLIVAKEHKPIIIDLLESCNQDREFGSHPWLKESGELSNLESDLGEVLACIYSARAGHKVSIPVTSNNGLKDFDEDDVPVSVKSPKGGSVALGQFADIMTKGNAVEQVLWSFGNRDKETMFLASSRSAGIIKDLSKLVGGTTITAVENFVINTDYDYFYKWIREHKDNPDGLGVPEQGVPKKLWQLGDTNPFYFTLCTLINRIWSVKHQAEVSAALKKILTGPKFYDVKIDLSSRRVIITEQRFEDVENWTTHYWSRATAAFHNWPGAKRIK
jgi:hypothetical protein